MARAPIGLPERACCSATREPDLPLNSAKNLGIAGVFSLDGGLIKESSSASIPESLMSKSVIRGLSHEELGRERADDGELHCRTLSRENAG